jgi:hypothetical protein
MGLPRPPWPCMRAGSALLDVERSSGSLRCPESSRTHRSLAPIDASSFHRGWDSPSESFALLATIRPVGRIRLPLRFLALQRHPRASPMWDGLSSTAPAPLSGFLASQRFAQARVPRPYFVPRPFLGFPFRAFPSQGSWVPSRGHLLPCGHPPARGATHGRRLVASGFPDARARAQLPGSPGDYGLPFPRPRPGSRSPWTTNEDRPSRQLHPLRSLAPPTSPFPPTRVAPNRQAAALLGFFPSRVPSRTSDPRTRSEDRSPPRQVRPPRRCEQQRFDLSAASGPLRDRAAPPLDGAPSPAALGPAVTRWSRPSELRSARKVTALRRKPPASHGVSRLLVDLTT